MSRAISFKCPKCGEEHERYAPAEMTRSRCPKCGSMAEKEITVPAIHYKGSGWAGKRRVQT